MTEYPDAVIVSNNTAKNTKLEMFKYAYANGSKPSDDIIDAIAASDDAESFKHVTDGFDDARLISLISDVRHPDIMRYLVSKLGAPQITAVTSLFKTCMLCNYIDMVDYMCSIGRPVTQADFIFAANQHGPVADLMTILLNYGTPTEPIVVANDIECIKVLHDAGEPITHELFQYVVDNMLLDCIEYIHALYPTWTTVINCIFNDVDGIEIPSDAAAYCISIGCTIGPAMCEAAVWSENYESLKLFHEHGAPFGNAVFRAIMCDHMKMAVYMVKHGADYTSALSDADDTGDVGEENATYQYISALVSLDVDI